MRRRMQLALAAAAVAALAAAGVASGGSAGRTLAPGTQFFVPPPDLGAVQQGIGLVKARDLRDAALLAAMEAQGRAVWFTSGTPAQVQSAVRRTMLEAALERRVPVLVAYDLPFRDCGQYSAGGAASTADYLAWIDGLARGIGNGQAVVILEPDGLGLVPGQGCTPSDADLAAAGLTLAQAEQARYDQLNGAVDRLEQQPNASVYLDGTHSAWLGVGDIAQRLVRAGVQRAQGFFLNASNYQPTPNLVKYGTWISDCIAFANDPEEGGWRLGHYDYCASQYYPANPSDFSTWTLSDQWYASNMGTAQATTHFVIDTSRNGQGPLDATQYAAAPYDQPPDVIAALGAGSWCNPPGAGLGLRPTVDTGVPLLDAYLWIKTPGESDGQCNSAGGARAWDYAAYDPWGLTDPAQQALFDPLWGIVDPAAGAWFPQQALQLAQNASPALLP